MSAIDDIEILRSIHGVPITCLIALLNAQKPVGLGWLVHETGYSDKPVVKALNCFSIEFGK